MLTVYTKHNGKNGLKGKEILKNDMWVNMETKKMHCTRKNMHYV